MQVFTVKKDKKMGRITLATSDGTFYFIGLEDYARMSVADLSEKEGLLKTARAKTTNRRERKWHNRELRKVRRELKVK